MLFFTRYIRAHSALVYRVFFFIRFRDLTDSTTGITYSYDTGRYVSVYHASRADDRIITYGHAGKYGDICSDYRQFLSPPSVSFTTVNAL